LDTKIAAIALFVSFCSLVVSICALGLSVHFWRRSFRPIVTAAVKTADGGNVLIAYNLVLLNSGTIPAKNIRISASESSLVAALGEGASDEKRKSELACFNGVAIDILQNNDRVSCPFGDTTADNQGFWKYGASVPITITYQGWFGKKYKNDQTLKIVDSNSFTGYFWGTSQ
jgi:hypothetical protein